MEGWCTPLDVPDHWLPIVSSLVDILQIEQECLLTSHQVSVLQPYVDTLRQELSEYLSSLPEEELTWSGYQAILEYYDNTEHKLWRRVFYPANYHIRKRGSVAKPYLSNPLGLAVLLIANKLAFSQVDGRRVITPSKRKRSSNSPDSFIIISSDESDEGERQEEVVSPWQPMPTALHTYYHTVVYFSNERSIPRRNDERVELAELSESLKKYIVGRRKELTKNIIVAEHLYASDLDVVRNAKLATIIRDGNVEISTIPEPTAFIEPHLHIVWWRASNNRTYGIEGLLGKWADKFRTRVTISSSEVKCYHCIREYLRQGAGRVVRVENISSPVEQRQCVRRTQSTESDRGDDVRCEDYRGPICGASEGKIGI